MPQKKELHSLIEQSLNRITELQQENGAFLSDTSTDPDDFSSAEKKASIFPSALILSSLQSLQTFTEAKTISKRLVDFLLTQKSDHWSFNYWEKGSKEAEQTPYPDDLDDTACILSALFLSDPNLIGGDVIAQFVSLLTFVEKEEGGPYKTWIVPDNADKAWQDIDLAVNSNIAYCLQLQDVELDSLYELVDQAIERKAFHSPYYTEEYSLLYFISRFYKGEKKQDLIDYLLSLQKDDANWGNALNTALSLIALSNLGYNLSQQEKSIEQLLQLPWEAKAFCTELITSETTYYSGAEALTIAFCLEALQAYLSSMNQKEHTPSKTTLTNEYSVSVLNTIRKRFTFLTEEQNHLLNHLLEKIEKIDKHQMIVLLPKHFAQTIKTNSVIETDFLQQLSLANVYGWLAYTIYDDFFDHEGKTEQLPIANTALRELTSIYENTFREDPTFVSFFHDIMNQLDQTNLWEAQHCHRSMNETITVLPDFGDYGQLAQKSLGHALGPLAILHRQGYEPTSDEAQTILSFFKNYIISRQLNDDMHDWEEDLRNGVFTSVNTPLLQLWKKKKGLASFTLKEVHDDLPLLQSLFWQELVVEQCDVIMDSVQKAKTLIEDSTIIKETDFFFSLLSTSEQAAKECLQEREKTMQFLTNFQTMDA